MRNKSILQGFGGMAINILIPHTAFYHHRRIGKWSRNTATKELWGGWEIIAV